MPIRFYKLFDLLNRRGMKKSDLRKIISSATVAKLSKGEYVSSEVIEKICLFLHCQPSDIMEVVEIETFDKNDESLKDTRIITKTEIIDEFADIVEETIITESKASNVTFEQHEEITDLDKQVISVTRKQV